MSRLTRLCAGMLAALATLTACGGGGGGGGTGNNATPTQVAFTVQPSNEVQNLPIFPAVKVEVEDATGARVTASSATVSLALQDNPGGSTLGGTLSRIAINGIATFNDLTLDKLGTGYTLQATSAGLTADVSSAFNVIALPPPPSDVQVTVGPNVSFTSVHNGGANPAVDTVAVAGTVTWTWATNPLSHSVQSTGLPSFTSSTVSSASGHQYAVIFGTAGTYEYDCSVHGIGMTGRIVVR